MSTVKKPVERQTAELRVLTDFFTSFFASDEQQVAVDKWVTPELVTTATTAISNLLAVLVLIGWLSSSDVETLTKAVVALVGAGEVIVVNSVLIWKFISSRLALKSRVLEMKYQYVEALAVEQMRASK
jgi:hypothetical protein